MVNRTYSISIIAIVAMITGLTIYFRAEYIIEPEKIEVTGLQEVAKQDATGFALLAIMFSGVVFLVHRGLMFLINDKAIMVIQIVAVIATITLSLIAAKVRPAHQLGGVPEVIFLNIVWGIGLGLLLPLFLD